MNAVKRELKWWQRFYLPEHDVEPSFVFYPWRGRKDKKLPLREKINMQVDEFQEKYLRPDELEGFAGTCRPLLTTHSICCRVLVISGSECHGKYMY